VSGVLPQGYSVLAGMLQAYSCCRGDASYAHFSRQEIGAIVKNVIIADAAAAAAVAVAVAIRVITPMFGDIDLRR